MVDAVSLLCQHMRRIGLDGDRVLLFRTACRRQGRCNWRSFSSLCFSLLLLLVDGVRRIVTAANFQAKASALGGSSWCQHGCIRGELGDASSFCCIVRGIDLWYQRGCKCCCLLRLFATEPLGS